MQTGRLSQKSTVCKSCPWTKANPEYYFPPQKLAESIVDSLEKELLHSCHSTHEHFCTGYLSYVEQNLADGLMSLTLGRLALYLGKIDRASIPQLEVFKSVEEMLQAHQTRMELDEL